MIRVFSFPLLALALLAPAPPPPVNTARIFLHTLTAYGPLEIWTAGNGYCYARPDGTEGAWFGPAAVESIDTSGEQDATVGTTFCAEATIAGSGPYGSGAMHFTKEVTIEVTAPTLGEAVAEAHQQIVDVLAEGWKPTPCTPSN